MAGMAMLLQSSALISPAKPIYSSKASTPKISHITLASTSANDYPSKIVQKEPQICQDEHISRRHGLAAAAALILIPAAAAKAEFIEEYKVETQDVIDQVRKTLSLEKSDPAKPDAVAALRQTSNYWVAKYRREKQVAGKPSFSNMYSVLNAISGHYISFGPASNIPAKRQQRILQEVTDAEKALKRGR